MRRVFKVIGYILLSLVVLLVVGLAYVFISANNKSKANLSQLSDEVKTISADGFSFRDLNKNGKLDTYEDKRQPVESRVSDLLSQMTLEEKVGTMFINIIKTNSKGELAELPEFGSMLSFVFPSNSELIVGKKMNNFNFKPGTHESWLLGKTIFRK